MPTHIKCSKCGFIIKKFKSLPSSMEGLTWYQNFYEKNKECPQCGHQFPLPIELKYKADVTVQEAP